MMAIIDPKPQGVVDWTLCACIILLAVPVLLTFGVFTLGLRAVLKVGA